MPEDSVISRTNRGDAARAPFARVLAAALRLAAVYGVGVTVLLAVVVVPLMLTGSVPRFRELLAVVSIPFLVTFGVSFLLLAVTRRFGFALAWLALLALWVLALRSQPVPLANQSFVLWSVFAAPLFAMVVIGVPASGAWSTRALALGVSLGWVLLFVAAEVALFRRAPIDHGYATVTMDSVLSIISSVAPFVISGVALWRLRPLFARGRQHAG